LNRVELLEMIPEIKEIQSVQLMEKTIDAFLLAFKKGGWTDETLLMAPVSVNRKNCDVGLFEHIRSVTNAVIDQFEILKKYFDRHNITIDRDLLICGALTHDLGKFTEYTIQDGHPTHGENFLIMRHPLSGALIAAEAGLPEEVIHIIATHSFEGEKSYRSAESNFIRVIDDFVFNNSTLGMEGK
jgi:putative nucleotidyltransferase with HDIG domain